MSKDETFEGVEGKAGQLLAKRVQIRHRRSTIEGWLERVRPDGRVEGRVSGIAATGRAKHSGIVNVPNAEAFFGKQMRKCFTHDKGMKLVSVDADSCQNKMLGQRAQSAELARLLIEEDTHTLVKDAVNSVLRRKKLPEITRGFAKGVGFAYRFGASDNKLGDLCGGGKQLGGEIREAINAVFPAQASLLERLTKEWRSNATRSLNKWGKISYRNGWIKGLDGRPIQIESEHQILVYMLQSDEAIMMSAAYCIGYKLLTEKLEFGKDFGITLWMHDEYTVECKEEHIPFVKECLEKSITMASEHFNMFTCPQTGTADVGDNWLEVH
jgi:DNA polymerase I-like protein with 3'-5' exonuclease and polymerase domains